MNSVAKVNFEEVIINACKKIGYIKENGYDLDNVKITVLIEK